MRSHCVRPAPDTLYDTKEKGSRSGSLVAVITADRIRPTTEAFFGDRVLSNTSSKIQFHLHASRHLRFRKLPENLVRQHS